MRRHTLKTMACAAALCSLLLGLAACGVPASDNQDDSGQDATPASEFGASSSSAASAEASSSSAATTGELPASMTFGAYPQQDDSAEPIEWIVIDRDESGILLLSKRCLASLPWHSGPDAATWDGSGIRAWLNGEFLGEAFTEEERAAIVPSALDNGDDMGYGTPAGADTTDSVFLLSADEALGLLGAGNRTAAPTAHAIDQGAYANDKGNCAW